METRMSSDGHAVKPGQLDRTAHHGRVAGVKAAGDVDGRNARDDALVVAVTVDAEGLADVGVQVNLHGYPGSLALSGGRTPL
jgi:hypothetical protein